MKWQPIETAPNDCVEVLVWTPSDGPFVAFHLPTSKQWMWTTHLLDGHEYIHPTHWMPLPDPPQ